MRRAMSLFAIISVEGERSIRAAYNANTLLRKCDPCERRVLVNVRLSTAVVIDGRIR